MKTNRTSHFKERRVSLQETMNQMARRMDGLLDQADQKKEPGAKPEPQAVSEDMRLWAAIDPLLADLQKHLADAKANMLSLQKRHGAKDPMAEVAQGIAESAASAVETRLIELRQNTEKKEALKALIIKEMDDEFFAGREAERIYSKNFWAEFARPKGKRIETAAKRVAEDSFLMVAASLMILQHNLDRTQRALSIAAKFSAASANDRFTSDRQLAGSV